MDNFNTHCISSHYETFTPNIARKLEKHLEVHFIPKHGSWLHIAEIELSVLTLQFLNRRIDTSEELKTQVAAWEVDHNHATKAVDWLFTTDDARIRLKRLYPRFSWKHCNPNK